MRRLDGLSALFVYSDKPKCYQHTLKIAILEGRSQSMASYEDIVAAFGRNIASVPMLRWKLARVPFSLNHPVWVEARDFDVRYHVRHVTCPAPGDERAFCELVSQLYAYPMDKSCPLWLSWVVDGLEGGRAAVVTLLHHAYTDGAGAARLLQRMVAPDAEASYPIPSLGRDAAPGKLRLLFRGLLDLPLTFVREVPALIRGIRSLRTLRERIEAEGGALPPSPTDAPDSPFNSTLSHRRSFVYRSFALDEVKAISHRLGITINDLFVTVCAGAFRRFMIESGAGMPGKPLVGSIPISQRPPPEVDDLVGNLVYNSYMLVPVHLPDPVERLQAVRMASRTMKNYVSRSQGIGLTKILDLMPPLFAHLTGMVVEYTKGKVNLGGNLVLSNVAGPREPLQMLDVTVGNWLSIGQVSGGLALNTTAWSYAEHFNICLMADAQVVPDGWLLIDYVSAELDTFRGLAAAATHPS